MADMEEIVFGEYRYRQLERSMRKSEQEKKRNSRIGVDMPTRQRRSRIRSRIRKTNVDPISPKLKVMTNTSWGDRNVTSSTNLENAAPQERKRMFDDEPISRTSAMLPSETLCEIKPQGQSRHSENGISTKLAIAADVHASNNNESGNVLKDAINILPNTPCASNSEKNVRVFHNWSVMLNKQYQLVLKGTLECGTDVRSKPVAQRLSALNVVSIYQNMYVLKDNLLDERYELPDYVRGKFYNGFPEDWKNVLQLWRKFVAQDCKPSFCWPNPLTDYHDDSSSRKHVKQPQVVPAGPPYNTTNMGDNLRYRTQSKAYKVNDSCTQTPAVWQHHLSFNNNSNGNSEHKGDLSQEEVIEKYKDTNVYELLKAVGVDKIVNTVQKENLTGILNNIVQKDYPQEYIDKVIEIFHCFNYVLSYNHCTERNSSLEISEVTDKASSPVQTHRICEITHHSASEDSSNSMGLNKDTTFNMCDLKKPTNISNQLQSDKTENSDEYESEVYAGICNVSMEHILSSRALLANARKQKGKKNMRNSSELKENTHANKKLEKAKCHCYIDPCISIAGSQTNDVSFGGSHQGGDDVTTANANGTFASHRESPRKGLKPRVLSSENLSVNVRIVPKHVSTLMEYDSDSHVGEKDPAQSIGFPINRTSSEPKPQNEQLSNTNKNNSQPLDHHEMKTDSLIEQAELSIIDLSNEYATGCESNPKLLTLWVPKVVPRQQHKIKFGLIFEGNLLNDAGHVLQKHFATNFVLRRVSIKLFETVDHEFFQLIGQMHDPKHDVPPDLVKRCRKGCPAGVDKFCEIWVAVNSDKMRNSWNRSQSRSPIALLAAPVGVSSRGRRVLPPLNYWTGERVVVKDDSPMYDPGSSDVSILVAAEGTPTKASVIGVKFQNARNTTKLNEISKDGIKPKKRQNSDQSRFSRSKRNESFKRNDQLVNKKSVTKKASTDLGTKEVSDDVQKENISSRKRVKQILQFESSDSDGDNEKRIKKNQRGAHKDTDLSVKSKAKLEVITESTGSLAYTSKLRKRQRVDAGPSGILPKMNKTRASQNKKWVSNTESSFDGVSCLYIQTVSSHDLTLSDDPPLLV